MQIDIAITILSSLFTGGILVIFIESQHTSESVNNKIQFVLRPFMHKFTNFVMFVSFIRTCYNFSPNLSTIKKLVEEIAKLAFDPIMSGQDYPINHFSAQKMEKYCDDINNIWYWADRHWALFKRECGFDATNASDSILKYYREVFSLSDKTITIDMLPNASSEFYVNCYQPVGEYFYIYEIWKKKENLFRYFSVFSISITLTAMTITLIENSAVDLFLLKGMCIISTILLLIQVIGLISLDNFAKRYVNS